ncbi:MAG: hypothetical protein AAGE84_10485 [Cyanobacteria bacterium P01_G01_bin.39]
MVDIKYVNTAFSPAQEILDPELFVGRKEQIKDGMLSLNNPGSFMSIYGLRGVGKSSIAHQIELIAQGNRILPKILDLTKFIPKGDFKYLTHYIKVDNFIENVEDLIQRILFGDNNSSSLFSLTKSGDRKLDAFKRIVGAEGGGNFFGVKLGAKGTEEKSYKTYVSDDLIQQFKQILGTIQKDNQQASGLLILIDEFDTLKDKSGFSSIIKTCSSSFVKFGVIGIASDITELIEDHSSIGRQIESIEVDRMPEYELLDILGKAEFHVRKEIIFDDSSKHSIVGQSEGFPYFVHLLGREAMLIAFERGQRNIDNQIISLLSEKIANGKLKTIYENIYHSAVKNSPQRELLLKTFSETQDDEMHTENVYRFVKELGVTNPSQLMKELTAPEKGSPVLIKIREKYYRFSDPVFKSYARLRNWKYQS